MSERDDSCFGYRVRKDAEGWSWTTFDLLGRVQERGRAPNRAIAAACVIRALARYTAPDARARTAA